MSRVLGIETSCDETALALIEVRGKGADLECKVIASLVHSQAQLHSAYGGVYPTLAKREHSKNLVPLLHKLIIESAEFVGFKDEIRDKDLAAALDGFKDEYGAQNPDLLASVAAARFLKKPLDVDAIAVTEGPGLEPALWVGINFARMLATLWSVSVIAVDHMEGHIVGSLLRSDATSGIWQKLEPAGMPAVAFLISGGHTQLVRADELGRYEIIGDTVDDALGEAFDKAARLLDLPYPGGPYLSMLAQEARDAGVTAPLKLPRPMKMSGDLRFSFSGLKTAVLYAVRTAPKDARGNMDVAWKKGLAREFEDAAVETLAYKLRMAVEQVGAASVIVGGGVSANHTIRKALKDVCEGFGIPMYLPSGHISGDNALMIALAGSIHGVGQGGERLIKASGTKKLGEHRPEEGSA